MVTKFNEQVKRISSLTENEAATLAKYKTLDEALQSWAVSKEIKTKILAELMEKGFAGDHR